MRSNNSSLDTLQITETLVHLVADSSGFRAVARVPGFSPLKPGERVAMVPDMARAVEFSDNKGGI